MPLFDHLHFVTLQGKFEKCDYTFIHKLSCNRTAPQSLELLSGEATFLTRLDNADLIFAALSLHGDHVVTAPLIQTDI